MLFHVKLDGKFLGTADSGAIDYLPTAKGAVVFDAEEWQARWERIEGAELVFICPVCEDNLLAAGQTVCLSCGLQIVIELSGSGILQLMGRFHNERQTS